MTIKKSKKSKAKKPTKKQIELEAQQYAAEVILIKPLERWEKKRDNPVMLVNHGLLAMIIYEESFFKHYKIKFPVKAEVLLEAFHCIAGNRIDKIEKSNDIGFIVQLLWIFGASRHQAILAVAEWHKLSESKVKKANKDFIEDSWPEKSDLIINMMTYCENNVIPFIDQTKARPFPVSNSYKKVLSAFEIIKKVCEKKEDFIYVPRKPMLPRYRNIKRNVLALYPDVSKRGYFEFD